MADRTAFDAAVAHARSAPEKSAAWDDVETLAKEPLGQEIDAPDDIVALYREVLERRDLARSVVTDIGERAAAFCDEWFGDDPSVLEGILTRVLDLDPESEWAFQRLTVVYSVGERWTDLLRLYDRALTASAGAAGKARRIRLLREAAQVAKDVANQSEKAIGYLQQLLPLTPDDVSLGQTLERLLERHERWADLIQLWVSRLEGMPRKERERSRARIAAVWLDNLNDPGKALAAARPLLAEAEDDREACRLLERVLAAPSATSQVRESVLDLLRAHYDAAGKSREAIAVLESAIDLVAPAVSQQLREEVGARLAELNDDAAAMDHYAALFALVPDSSVTQEKLRQLAQRSGNYARYASGVAAAAGNAATVARKVELLAEAARTRLDLLDDEPGAIELYRAALAQNGIEAREQLLVCRRLSELYSRSDRPRDRLDVLERLAGVESSESSRRAVLGEAARLAESLGETDRALSLWRRRIDSDPTDQPALDAFIALLETSQRWEPLIEALAARVGRDLSPSQRRADLVRIATINEQQRDDVEAAIVAWRRVQTECGEDAETVAALADLLSTAGRWAELAELLERASGRDTTRVTTRLVRLADAYREHLAQPTAALAAYRGALAIEPTSESARTGLTGLLEVAACRAGAADALAASYRTSADWRRFVALLPARLADATDPRARLALLREAGEIQRDALGDRAAALTTLAQAFPLAPRDQALEGQLVELAGAVGDWRETAAAFTAAIGALGNDPHEAARLRSSLGEILETRLAPPDPAGALAAFVAVSNTQPGNLPAVRGVLRLATRLGRWDDAAVAAVGYTAAQDRVDAALYAELDDAATAAGAPATDDLARVLGHVLDAGAGLAPRVAAELHAMLGRWQRDRRGDTEAAQRRFHRALALDGNRADVMRELAALERATPGRPLYQTLRRLADADGADLEALREAAALAQGTLRDPEAAAATLTVLLGRATAAWRGTAPARAGDAAAQPESIVRGCIDGLVDLHLDAGRAAAAVDLLVDASRLAFDGAIRRAMRHRAAAIATADLRDNATAIEMYRGVLAQAPDDREAMERIGALLAAEGRVPELLSLRQHQLRLESDATRRLELRLDIAKLVGHVEEHGGRLEALRQNLTDSPGHEESIEAMAALLAGKRQWSGLAEVLEEQAGRLEQMGEPQRSARLWARVARVAEVETTEIDRAIAAHRKVVALAPTPESLRALARLHMERNQPAQAVPWFENLLAATPAEGKAAVVLQLARAHLGALQPERAIAALEGHLGDREPALDLRHLLAQLYRDQQAWDPLARHLTRSLPLVDAETALAFAREAAAIYTEQLDSPAKAIPALERALSVHPDDKALRAQLATGLRHAGQLDKARALLAELINDFGRRRSPERATLHVELARVASREGKSEEALAEMELASKMDAANARIQKELAELSIEAGQLDKAERTYRALLLVVRRQPPGDDESAVGVAEVLYELHNLATKRGEADQARELLESALDTAVQSDAEVRRLKRSLLAHGKIEQLLAVLERRIAASDDPKGQASLLIDVAEVQDKAAGKPSAALDAVLRATQLVPSQLALIDRARELARRADRTRDFVSAVDATVDRLRRKEDPPMVATMLMKAGEALEHDAADPRGALSMYRRVESMGIRAADAYFAMARVAGLLGDTDEQARALDAMLKLTESSGADASPAKIDALYRLSEIFIGSAARREQGVDLIEQAFAAEPRYAQAGRILRAAAAADPTDRRVMALYERVARNAGDSELLLDFLERRGEHTESTPAQVREAIDLAVANGQTERAQRLLERAVEAARASFEGVSSAVWAVVALADVRLGAGDLERARDLVYEIGHTGEELEIERLALAIAERATAGDRAGKTLAAEIYEFLRERSPSARRVWEPLLELYRALGDGDRLANVIAGTLPALTEVSERNALRMQHARYFIDNLKRHHDAVEVLRDVLLDNPDDLEAAALLESVLRTLGDDDGLADFLWQRFEDARGRRNPATVIDVANRLGSLLDGMGSADAGRVYSAALEIAPDDRDLLRAVIAHLDPEADGEANAALMERLLTVEDADRVPALVADLTSRYQTLDDGAGVQRVLELGYRRCPDNQRIHAQLEQWYREREQWPQLAALMIADAEHLGHAPAVARLREAAAVYRDRLGDAGSAASVLRRARVHDPRNGQLVAELMASLVAAGDMGGALDGVTQALDDIQGAARVDLLLVRADLRAGLSDEAGAVADLDEAYGLDEARAAAPLLAGLERHRLHAEQSADIEAERTALLRLASLLRKHGDADRARDILIQWIEREPSDAEPLYLLRDMDAAIDHWDGVVAACARLAVIETGDAQVDAALRLAEGAERAGKPGDALAGLEMVHAAQPQAQAIRDRLRQIYELAGAHEKLAGVLLADADHGSDPAVRFANYKRVAELYLRDLGDAAAALTPAQRACELAPEDHEAAMLYVDVLIGGGHTAAAGAALEASINAHKKRSPELAMLQQRMGRVCAMLGDRDAQLAWLKKAFDVDRKSGEVAAELAQLATEIGDYELALKPLRAISLMDNPQPITRTMALLWEAKIEHARGNRAKAELWAKKALREDPSFLEAQQFLAQIAE